ncbi:unnamed protein product [Adineta steineri]|uniref:NHL repeat containing protein n=1 Tax=Adineta steineri TaxID=433720 RepID=A0A814UMU3_9BILA|nr:unnamed protein product [Adineta steineri]CAF1176157.1 unnamed protein product [Adineta steineri]
MGGLTVTLSEPQSALTRKKATITVLSQPALGKLPKPNCQNMEYKKLLIGKNEEDIEMAAERVTAHNASSEYKSESKNKNNIRKSTRPHRGSKIVFCFSTIVAVLILITIISIAIWVMFIKKAEATNNITTSTIDASTTKTTIRTTSTTETRMVITLTTKTAMVTTSTTTITMPTSGITMITTSTNSLTTTMNVSKFNKWKQNAITVAGGNEQGQELDQLKYPEGIFIDENKNIFIADCYNHRIVEWKYSAKEGQIIAGGNEQGNRMDQLYQPTNMIVDQQNHSIIIADQGNRRVIQWLNQKQQILIDNIACLGLTMDENGFLYVSDAEKNEVRRWKMGEYNNEGIVVAGGNGPGNQLNQLHRPTYIFVDDDQSVYVSDYYNQRVMKWRKDAEEGTIVAGGNGQGEKFNQLSSPEGVIIDDLDQIYVADSHNNRVIRWREGKEEGEIVVGGNGAESQSNQLNSPNGLSFDDEGNLYVADDFNNRIQKFEIIL